MKLFVIVLLLASIRLSHSNEEDAMLLLYLANWDPKNNNSDNNPVFNDSIKTSSHSSIPDLNIQLPENEDEIFYGEETNTFPLLDLNIDFSENLDGNWNTVETNSTSKDNVTITKDENFIETDKGPRKSKRKSIFKKEFLSPFGESPIYYLLSRFCYEKRFEGTRLTQNSFGRLVYGDTLESVTFRAHFGIEKKEYKQKKRIPNKINNYFYEISNSQKKKCLKDITQKEAINNIIYWKKKVEDHPNFEELKEMGDRLFPLTKNITLVDDETFIEYLQENDKESRKRKPKFMEESLSAYEESPIYYLLSRFCYEKRFTGTNLTHDSFARSVYGDTPEILTFRTNFGIEKQGYNRKNKIYNKIKNYFNGKTSRPEKKCLSDITKQHAENNIIYWKEKAENHPNFKELKEMGDRLFPLTKNIILAEDESPIEYLQENNKGSRKRKSNFEKEFFLHFGESPIYYLLSRFCFEKRIKSKTNLTQNSFGRLVYGDSPESIIFRTNFGIKKERYNPKNRIYNRISSYFNGISNLREKQCLIDITKEEAKNNIIFWKKKVENHPNFEELKKMGDRLFPLTKNITLSEDVTPIENKEKNDKRSRIKKRKSKIKEEFFSPYEESPIYYLLSRFCYEKRFMRTNITQNYFGRLVYGNSTESIKFRTKFGIKKELFKQEKRSYCKINNYFNGISNCQEKQCFSGITKKEAKNNIKYWKKNVENHTNFEELKEMGDRLFPLTKNITLTDDETIHLQKNNKGSRKRKRSKFEEEIRLPYGESPLYYLLSRFCYEKRFMRTNLTQNSFGRLVYGDSLESATFRTKFGIEKEVYKQKKRLYNKITNYFNIPSSYREQKCLSDITEREAKNNIIYWEKKVETHPNFEELKEMGYRLFPSTKNITLKEDETLIEYLLENNKGSRKRKRKSKFEEEIRSPYEESPLYYLLSRFCYEKRFMRTNLTQNSFGRLVYGDSPESVTFRTNFRIEKEEYNRKNRIYNKISNYFNGISGYQEYQCLSDISEKEAKNNIIYWKKKVENHPNFNQLKEIADRIFPLTSSF